MNKLLTVAVVPLAAGAVAGLLASGCSSSSSSLSGTETLKGTTQLTAAQANSQNFVPVIPLTASGVFGDTGSVALTPGSGKDGNGPGPAVIKLGNGNINVNHSATAGGQPVLFNGTCTYKLTQKAGYTITGGTGRYTGTTGHGTATVTSEITLPIIVTPGHTGGLICDTRSSTKALGGKVVFNAVGPVSVPAN